MTTNVETVVKKVIKRELDVGPFRIVQPPIRKNREVWVFNERTNQSVAIKAEIFEKAVRGLFRQHTTYTGE